jgi:hypothetical protein
MITELGKQSLASSSWMRNWRRQAEIFVCQDERNVWIGKYKDEANEK